MRCVVGEGREHQRPRCRVASPTIARVASTPSRTGICRSITATSGRCSRAEVDGLGCRRARRRPPRGRRSHSRRPVRPRRTTAWSSATTTRIIRPAPPARTIVPDARARTRPPRWPPASRDEALAARAGRSGRPSATVARVEADARRRRPRAPSRSSSRRDGQRHPVGVGRGGRRCGPTPARPATAARRRRSATPVGAADVDVDRRSRPPPAGRPGRRPRRRGRRCAGRAGRSRRAGTAGTACSPAGTGRRPRARRPRRGSSAWRRQRRERAWTSRTGPARRRRGGRGRCAAARRPRRGRPASSRRSRSRAARDSAPGTAAGPAGCRARRGRPRAPMVIGQEPVEDLRPARADVVDTEVGLEEERLPLGRTDTGVDLEEISARGHARSGSPAGPGRTARHRSRPSRSTSSSSSPSG